MAPMARRIANREHYRLVLAPRPLERLAAPWIPVHGIIGMLAQIRALLIDQAVGLAPGRIVGTFAFAHINNFRPLSSIIPALFLRSPARFRLISWNPQGLSGI